MMYYIALDFLQLHKTRNHSKEGSETSKSFREASSQISFVPTDCPFYRTFSSNYITAGKENYMYLQQTGWISMFCLNTAALNDF